MLSMPDYDYINTCKQSESCCCDKISSCTSVDLLNVMKNIEKCGQNRSVVISAIDNKIAELQAE